MAKIGRTVTFALIASFLIAILVTPFALPVLAVVAYQARGRLRAALTAWFDRLEQDADRPHTY